MAKRKKQSISELIKEFKELKLVEQDKLRGKSALVLLAELRKTKNEIKN